MSVQVFVSRDFELGRVWLAGEVESQSRTGLAMQSPVFPSLQLGTVTLARGKLCLSECPRYK